MINEEQIKDFNENGVLVLKNFYDYEEDIKPIQLAIYNLINTIIKKYNLHIRQDDFAGNNFDTQFYNVIQKDRNYCSEIYDAVKQIPAFIRLLSHPKNEIVAKILLESTQCGIARNGHGIRIDLPNEVEYKGIWHQEYPFQIRSLKGLVLWSPLVDIFRDLGPVEVCLKSHKDGIKFLLEDKEHKGTGMYNWRIKNEQKIINNYQKVSPLSSPGDLIILDWAIIHQSGVNATKDKIRWSMQMRYFDFLEKQGIKLKWRGSYSSISEFEADHADILI